MAIPGRASRLDRRRRRRLLVGFVAVVAIALVALVLQIPPDRVVAISRPAGHIGPEACENIAGGTTQITLFRDSGNVCIPPSQLEAYRCGSAAPVIEGRFGGHRGSFVGGRFAVPVSSLPPGASLAGIGGGLQVFTLADGPSWLYVRSAEGIARWLALPTDGPKDPPRALLIGDSILLGSEPAISDALSSWTLRFDAVVGRSSSEGVDPADQDLTDNPDVVVVELGTNDEDPAAFRTNLVAILDRLRNVPLVVWQTAHGPASTIPEINRAIFEETARHPNTAVADWDAAVDPAQLGSDGVHPLAEGIGAVADLLAPFVRGWRTVAAEAARSTPAPCSTV